MQTTASIDNRAAEQQSGGRKRDAHSFTSITHAHNYSGRKPGSWERRWGQTKGADPFTSISHANSRGRRKQDSWNYSERKRGTPIPSPASVIQTTTKLNSTVEGDRGDQILLPASVMLTAATSVDRISSEIWGNKRRVETFHQHPSHHQRQEDSNQQF